MERLLLALFLSVGISARDFRCETVSSPQKAASHATSTWTTGNKRVVVLRLEFPDHVDSTPTEQQCREMMDYADRVLRTNSYGTLSLTSTISSVLKMPKAEADFSDRSEIETNAWQLALQAGIHREDYDLDVIIGLNQANGEGFGNIGDRGIILKRAAADSVIVHELGHNLGLIHANLWVGYDDSISGLGENREYGDGFDIMGSGGRSFSSWGKWRLGWLPADSVRDITNSQTIEIALYETDTLQAGATHALRIPAGDKTYWVDCQLPTAEAPQLTDAILVRWAPPTQTLASTYLLDTRPETKLFTADASLLIGRTFSDRARKIHITPIKKTATGFSVEIQIGNFASNRPPELTISAPDIMQLEIGEPFQVSATASDPDGDPVSIAWDFADGSYGLGATVTNFFVENGEYSVICEASDHKGGVTMKSFVARVGSPTSFRLSGQVTRKGVPLPNARIYVPDQEMSSARTGPDGRYVLTGLYPGSYTLKGSFEGVSLQHTNFAIPYAVSSTQENLNWEYPEPSADNLSLDVLEDSEENAITLIGHSLIGALTYNVQEFPRHGILTGSAPALRYTPDPNYSGPDSFTYYVTDNDSSPPATVSITVQPKPDLPLVFGAGRRAESVMTAHLSSPNGGLWDACVADHGRIYALCWVNSTSPPVTLVRCLDAQGNQEWDRVFGFSLPNAPDAIFPRSDGVVVTGRIIGADGYNVEWWMARVTSGNQLLWLNRFKNWTSLVAQSRGEDAFILAGIQSGSSLVAKIDGATGHELWRSPAPDGFNPYHIDIGEDGTFAVTGWIWTDTQYYHSDCVTLKYSVDGELLWDRRFSYFLPQRGGQVLVAPSGDVYVAIEGNGGTRIVRYSNTGEALWQSDPFEGSPLLNSWPRVSQMVFDENDVLHVLAVDAGANWHTILLRFENETPKRIWTTTNAPPNTSAAFRRTASGAFEAVTVQEVGSEARLWLTTIDPSGAEISNIRLGHKGGFFPVTVHPSKSAGGFLIADGSLPGQGHIEKVVNETLPQTLIVPHNQSLVEWPCPISLDDKPLVVEATISPQHGTLTGDWPNWIYAPAPGYVGDDRIAFKVSQPGEQTIDGEFKIRVVAPLELRLEQSPVGAVTLTADPSAPISWSRDLKEWTPLRGPIPAELNVDDALASRFFRISP